MLKTPIDEDWFLAGDKDQVKLFESMLPETTLKDGRLKKYKNIGGCTVLVWNTESANAVAYDKQITIGVSTWILVGHGSRFTRLDVENIKKQTATVKNISPNGSYSLIHLNDDFFSVTTDIAGVCKTFYSKNIVSSNSLLLAQATQSSLDKEYISAQLLEPAPPLWTHGGTVWKDVNVSPTDAIFILNKNGFHHEEYRDRVSFDCLSLEEASGELFTALDRSVNSYCQSFSYVGADLSGGLDSTPLALLTAKYAKKSILHTYTSPLVTQNDIEWAESAARFLPKNARHVINHLTDEDLPLSPVPISYFPTDGPGHIDGIRAAQKAVIRSVTLDSSAPDVYLRGEGGDEVVGAVPGFFAADFQLGRLFNYFKAFRQTRAMFRWSYRDMIDLMSTKTDRSESMRLASESVLTSSDTSNQMTPAKANLVSNPYALDVFLPPWVTRDARECCSICLDRESQHRTFYTGYEQMVVDKVRYAGYQVRHIRSFLASHGLNTVYPFLEDSTVRAALSSDKFAKNDLGAFKPLTKKAFRNFIDPSVLQRTDKGGSTAAREKAFRKNKDYILSVVSSGWLSTNNLISAKAFEEYSYGSGSHRSVDSSLIQATVALELWIKDIQSFSSSMVVI